MAQSASEPDFLPTATLEALRKRAHALRVVRNFFDSRGYWEVQTPLLSHDAPADAHLIPFSTQWWPSGYETDPQHRELAANTLYLQTSPEFCMKRLLAAGADAIYQLGSAFRNAETGKLHNPEFTMLEWYRVGDTIEQQLQLVEDLVLTVFVESRCSTGSQNNVPNAPFARTSYRTAFQRELGVDISQATTADLIEVARQRKLSSPDSLAADDRDGWLNFLLALEVEPSLGRDRPEFLMDYPASQAALARIRHEEFPVAERFELYVRGIELCNGYVELTDPGQLSERIAIDTRRREVEGQPPLQSESRLLQAMRAGLPESVGVALGFDRLFMLAIGADSIDDVIPFPLARA